MDRNALVFKSTIYPEWYASSSCFSVIVPHSCLCRWTDRAMPWLHFVPIKVEYGDLYDTLAFFRGLPDGTPGHDDLAEKIANAGREFVDKFWRSEVSP